MVYKNCSCWMILRYDFFLSSLSAEKIARLVFEIKNPSSRCYVVINEKYYPINAVHKNYRYLDYNYMVKYIHVRNIKIALESLFFYYVNSLEELTVYLMVFEHIIVSIFTNNTIQFEKMKNNIIYIINYEGGISYLNQNYWKILFSNLVINLKLSYNRIIIGNMDLTLNCCNKIEY